MTNKLFIDGIDAYERWGVIVSEKGYDELFAYPALKKVKSIDWQEHDGEDWDLSAPVLAGREVNITFVSYGTNKDRAGFMEYLAISAHHVLRISDTGREYRLRVVSMPKIDVHDKLEAFTIRFAHDTPMVLVKSPQTTIVYNSLDTIDGIKFSQFGVALLQGCLDDVIKTPDVKQGLKREIDSQSGVICDPDAQVAFKSKKVKLSCLMRATSISELMNNHEALLHRLTLPEERELYITLARTTYPCRYDSCKTKKLYLSGKLWWEFELELVVRTIRP